MSNTLLTAAAASIILAVVGGGAKAFGVEVPVLASRKRQVALALVGVAFFAAAVVLREDNDGGGNTSGEVQAYRQHVLAACRGLEQVRGLPPLNDDLTVDRDTFLEWTRGQLATSKGILSALWERRVPGDLKEERDDARGDARDLVSRTEAGLDRLEEVLPTRFGYIQGQPPELQRFSAELASPAARFEASMSELAGEPCRPRQPGAGDGTG